MTILFIWGNPWDACQIRRDRWGSFTSHSPNQCLINKSKNKRNKISQLWDFFIQGMRFRCSSWRRHQTMLWYHKPYCSTHRAFVRNKISQDFGALYLDCCTKPLKCDHFEIINQEKDQAWQYTQFWYIPIIFNQ